MKLEFPSPSTCGPVRWTAQAVIGVLIFCMAQFANALGFSDTALDPSDYEVRTYVQGGTIAISAVTNANPGAGMLQQFTVPSPLLSTDHSYAYAINKNFVIDPAIDGPIGSISFAIDKSIVFQPAQIAFGNGQGMLVQQGGLLYQSDAPLAAVQGVFLTATLTNLTSANFYRVVNLATHQVDFNAHPDFTAGAMQVGWYNGAGVPVGAPNLQIQYVYDNFSVSVSAVPEPSAAMLWCAGLCVGLARLRRSL